MRYFIIPPVILICVLLQTCSPPRTLNIDQSTPSIYEEKYWIDFRAGFDNNKISLILGENDTLFNAGAVSTGNDGSYFTGERLIYRINKSKKPSTGEFLYKGIVVAASEKLLIDTLSFELIIDGDKFGFNEVIRDSKVIAISWDEKTNFPILTKYDYFFVYE